MQRETGKPSRLAAVLFERDDDVDAAIRDLVAFARGEGARVAGFVQEHAPGSEPRDVWLRDVESGARIAIMQDLGPGASGCRLDPAAIAVAAERIGRALADAPDLLVVNRFGKLESDGGGVLSEIGEAAARGVPVVVCVPLRFREAWDAFAQDLYEPLAPDLADLMSWWADVAAERLTMANRRPRESGDPGAAHVAIPLDPRFRGDDSVSRAAASRPGAV